MAQGIARTVLGSVSMISMMVRRVHHDDPPIDGCAAIEPLQSRPLAGGRITLGQTMP